VLPISIQPGTFKRDFLCGHGSLSLDWAGFDPTKPFDGSVTTVDSGSVTGSTGDLSFGQSNGLSTANGIGQCLHHDGVDSRADHQEGLQRGEQLRNELGR
jgi:hypothetical protein